jgi:hypothetical protein
MSILFIHAHYLKVRDQSYFFLIAINLIENVLSNIKWPITITSSSGK